MKITQKIGMLAPLALAALTLAGQASAQEQVVKIGHSGPLSGANAFAGKDNENGVRLALEELNAKKMVVGGKTLKFELVSEDDQCDAKSGVNVAQKLVDGGVKFVMGPYCSGVTIPASRIYDAGGALVSTVGTNPKVTQNGYKNLYRIIASDTQIGSNMATYAANVLKVKKVAVVDDRTAFGQGVAEEFTKEAKKLGLTVVGQEFTTDKSVDFLSILTSLKAKQPEAIFFGGYAPQAAPMARQMKQLGLRVEIDDSDDRMQKKIRNAQLQKVPFMLIAGDNDVEAGAVSFRYRDGRQDNGVPLAEAIERVRAAVESHEQV